MAKNLVSYVLVGKRIPGFKQKLAVLGNLNYHPLGYCGYPS